MSFSAFSKNFTSRSTQVDDLFITRFLPRADGDAVKAYLYGLYLCGAKEEIDAETAAGRLKLPLSRLLEIFESWEECGLVQILSKDPLLLEYLPVNEAIGRGRPVRAEKYSAFSRELLKLLQRAAKDFKPYEYQKILELLEESGMEPQAFLLVVESCVKKDGEKLTFLHVFNKAKRFVLENKLTYEEVLKELNLFDERERVLSSLFTALGIFRKPQESDLAYLDKWFSAGMEEKAIFECASALKKGSLPSLDLLISELTSHRAFSQEDAKRYLSERERRNRIAYAVGRKLGVKVENPTAFSKEYVEKWLTLGFDEESLETIAALCFKLGFGFSETDSYLSMLSKRGIVKKEKVLPYAFEQEKLLRLMQSVVSECGVIKKSQGTLDLFASWKESFSDEMILEAAKRSAGASSPLSYMNKLLTDWKRQNIFDLSDLKKRKESEKILRSETAVAADLRAEREHYYSVLRQSAFRAAEAKRAQAEQNEAFRTIQSKVKKYEIELARAEVYHPSLFEEIKRKLELSQREREKILQSLHLSDEDFEPVFRCKKCSDTGFLPSGEMCDCYPQR